MKRLAAVLVIGLMGWGGGHLIRHPLSGNWDAEQPPRLALNQAAPEFSLPSCLNDRQVVLRELKGQVVLINFWDTECPHCQDDVPVLLKCQRTFGTSGFQVLGIIVNRPSLVEMPQILAELKIDYPTAFGSEAVLRKYEGVPVVPVSFLVDREGRIVEKYSGAVSFSHLERAIRQIL